MNETENKKPKIVNPKTLAFFVGVTICLFSVVLIMNIGGFARVFAFVPFYLFGIGSYAFYLFLYSIGLSFLFVSKSYKIKLNSVFFGAIFLFFSLLMISTLLSVKSCQGYDNNVNNVALPTTKFYQEFNSYLFSAKTFYVSDTFRNTEQSYMKIMYWGNNCTKFINLFNKEIPLGGGLIGYLLVGIFNFQTNGSAAWTFAIIFAVLGLFLIILKPLMKYIKKQKNRGANKQTNQNLQTINANSGNVAVNNQPVFHGNERDIIAGASQIESGYQSEIMGATPPRMNATPVDFNQRNNVAIMTSPEQTYISDASLFVPAHFVRRGAIEQQMDNYPQNVPNSLPQNEAQIANTKPVLNNVNVATNTQNNVPNNKPITENQPKKYVQGQLDINAPAYDKELVTTKPEFAEIQTETLPIPNTANQTNSQPIDVPPPPQVKKKIKWIPPSSQLLQDVQSEAAAEKNNAVAEERKEMITNTFSSFGIGARCVSYIVGPSVTNFNIEYDSNVSLKSVNNIVQDISRNLGGVPARFQATVSGTTYSGIEVANAVITPVAFKEVFAGLVDAKKKPLDVAFGKGIDGKIIHADFAEFPHMLVSGTTGSGKSVFIHSVICTLIMRNSPDDLKLILVDPKQVEMSMYKDVPHLLCPVVKDMKKAKLIMDKLVVEMNDRYAIFDENMCRSITEYNEYAEENGKEKMPYIVMVIDEYADLVQTYKEVSQPVVMIAQKARAAGIHMAICTQRPSTDVITGVIKGNLPTKVALRVGLQVDSVTIIGEGGAEKLLGRGDMLVQCPVPGVCDDGGVKRVQSCFIQGQEMRHIVGYLKEHYQADYDPKFMNLEEEAEQAGKDFVNSPAFSGGDSDDNEESKYKSVKDWVLTNKYMSMSRIQRECGVGFNRAGRFFKRLQDEGIVATETEGNKGCPVLVNEDYGDENNVVTSEEVTI